MFTIIEPIEKNEGIKVVKGGNSLLKSIYLGDKNKANISLIKKI